MNKPLFCFYCARSFLSAASLITYQIGEGGREEVFHDRGYQAIERLAALKAVADMEGERFMIRMNEQRSDLLLFATVMVTGTSVCTSHLYDVDHLAGPYGRSRR